MKQDCVWLVLLAALLASCAFPSKLIRDTSGEMIADAGIDQQAATADALPSRYALVPARSKALFVAIEHWQREGRVDNVIGVTGFVTGAITIDLQHPINAQISPIQVNLFTLKTHDSELDEGLKYLYLQADLFPFATFTPNRIDGLPETCAGLPTTCNGQTAIKFTVSGELMVRDVTQPVTFDVTATLLDDELVGLATAHVAMTDFGITPPSKPGISWVEDGVTIELEFVATQE